MPITTTSFSTWAALLHRTCKEHEQLRCERISIWVSTLAVAVYVFVSSMSAGPSSTSS